MRKKGSFPEERNGKEEAREGTEFVTQKRLCSGENEKI
jgi:hypothetical protein